MLFPLTNDDCHCLVDGEWRRGRGELVEVLYPSTNEQLFLLSAASTKDVDDAVAAAWRAFRAGPWSRLSGIEKGKLITKLASLFIAGTDGAVRFCEPQARMSHRC
jgi:acyl-CoA reductase-like NAD-dependent aldehyde dehydrogenase